MSVPASNAFGLRRLYDWMMAVADRPAAVWVLAVVSFTESSFFPVPPDPLLVAMALARPSRAWWFAFVCTVSSVLGGLFGYLIGYLLYESVGHAVIEAYGLQSAFAAYTAAFADYGLWIILVKGLTPIPYKLVTIASGVAQMDLVVFVLASIVTRGARFYLAAAILRKFGAPMRSLLERYFAPIVLTVLGLVVAGFVAVYLLG